VRKQDLYSTQKEKIKGYNDQYKKKDHIKLGLEMKQENEKSTLKEINRLK